MRHQKYLFLLLNAMWPISAAAALDCNVINGLERVAHAQDQMFSDTSPIVSSMAMSVVTREMQNLDAANVSRAIRDHPLERHAATLIGFTNRATILASYGRSRNEAGARQLLGDPTQAKILDAVVQILISFDCHTPNAIRGAQNPSETQSQNALDTAQTPINTLLALKFVPGLLTFLGFGAAAAVRPSILAYRKYKTQRRRRGKRYPTNLACVIDTKGSQSTIVLKDLSCRGAMFQHDPDVSYAPSQIVSLKIGKKIRKARVSWANIHYCGIRFDRALSLATVLSCADKGAIISAKTDRAPQNAKTAPETAPLS